MTKHTPGPWIYDSGCAYAENGQGRIALVDRDNPRTQPVERDLNMRLIAAAPEMVELLRNVHELLHDDKPALHKMLGIGNVAGCPGCDILTLLAKIDGAA